VVEVGRQEVIQSAERLVRRGRIEAAIDEYRKVLNDEPDDTRTLNRVGDLFLRLDKMGQAIDLFCRAADHFSREGFFVKAIAIYKKVIRVDPTRIEAYEELADLYHRQGLINEARSQYQVVADYYGQQRDRGAQLKVFRKIAELDPEDPSPRLRLAEAYLEDGRAQDAMEQYRLIAGLMLAHDRIDDATRVYHRALELDPSDLGFVTDAVLELKERGYPTAARRLLDSSVALNPEAARVRDLVNLSSSAGLRSQPAAFAGPNAGSPDAGSRRDSAVVDLDVVEEVAAPIEEIAENLVDFAAEAIDLEDAIPETGRLEAAGREPAEVEPDSTVFFLDLDDPSVQVTAGVGGGAVEFEIGLDELDGDDVGEPVTAAETLDATPESLSFEYLDIDLAAGAHEQDTAEQVLELIAEAQVLATYGLDEAAAERFERVITLDPERLEAYARLAEIHLQTRDSEQLEAVVARAHQAVPEAKEPAAWARLRDLLEGEGYGLEGGRLLAPGRPTVAPQEELETERTSDESLEAHRPAVEEAEEGSREAFERAGPPEFTAESPFIEEVESASIRAGSAVEPAAEPETEPPVEPILERVEPEAVDAPPEISEDSAIRWLDELAGDAASRKAAGDEMFGQEDEFFDLAAELEEELREEEERRGEPIAPPAVEQSLEEIVEGFKEGVAATLAKEDYDTHYNLGIAYREMGLIDEAIGEFQLAAKDSGYLVDSCSLLGACFLEKGFGDLAIKWYQRGLDSPAVSEDETLGLLYEMGNLHLALGDVDEARRTFIEIYGVNSNYRDVVARLEDLRADD